MKDVVAMITHLLTDEVFKRYNKLQIELQDRYDVILLINNYNNQISKDVMDSIPKNVKYHYQSYDDLQDVLNQGYYSFPYNRKDFMWHNMHLIYLDFYLRHKEYNSYYYIEYDVIFNGNWSTLFDELEKYSDIDFLTFYTQKKTEQPDWYWFRKDLHSINLPDDQLLGSFNPFMKLTNEVLSYLSEALKFKGRAFTELAFITYINKEGFKIVSMVSGDSFSIRGLSGKFCNGDTIKIGTEKVIVPEKFDDLLYHPVKC